MTEHGFKASCLSVQVFRLNDGRWEPIPSRDSITPRPDCREWPDRLPHDVTFDLEALDIENTRSVRVEILDSEHNQRRTTRLDPRRLGCWARLTFPVLFVKHRGDGVDKERDIQGVVHDLLNEALDLVLAGTGRRLRVDTYNGSIPDVTFVRHPLTEEEIQQCNGLICGTHDDIFDVFDIGDSEGKIYLLFFDHDIQDASSSFNRSASAERGGPDEPGRSARLPLYSNTFLSFISPRTIAHEMFHTLGAVPDCATHPEPGGHVCDGRPDLMSYCARGDEIDPGNDDYYGHDIPGCWDTEDSPLWLDPPPATPMASRTRVSFPPPPGDSFLCKTQ